MSTATMDTSVSKRRRRVLWGAQSNKESLVTDPREIVSGVSPFPILSTYQEEWDQRQQRTPVHVDVTALASSCDGLLVACTSLGQVFVWEDNKGDTVEPCLESIVPHWKVSSLPLKSIQILDGNDTGNPDSHTIVVGGKEGMWTLPLKNHMIIQANKWDTVTCDVRQILVDRSRVFVLEESGEIKVYGLPVNRFLHAIDLHGSQATTMALAGSDNALPDSDDDSHASMDKPRTLLIGTSDSKILLWTPTTSSSNKVESISLHETDISKSENTGTGTGGTGSLPFEIVVTTIHCTGDNWWIIAGTCRNKKLSNRSILATLHGATRTLISHKVLRETIYGIHYHQSQSSRLYTIANEDVVSVWDSPYRLELIQRLWSSPPSGRAMVKVGSTRVAVAGIGSKIDLLENDCRVQSLLVDGITTGSFPNASGTDK